MQDVPAILKGKRGLVVGIANEHSIASGCAQAFRRAGASLAVTYQNDKARPFVEPVSRSLDAEMLLPLDVEEPDGLENTFQKISDQWGQIDFVLHSIAYCPMDDLHAELSNCSREGFLQAMNISVYSFIRMAHLAAPLMKNGGSLLTVSYYGAEKVVDNYNAMGPAKAALEASVKYLAAELGSRNIRVNALSPGPLKTRAGSGIAHFDALIDEARQRAPQQRLVSLNEVGAVAVGLVSDLASGMTGNIAYVDAGFHVMS